MKCPATVLAKFSSEFNGKKYFRYTVLTKTENGSIIGSVSSLKEYPENSTVYLDWKTKIISNHECLVPFIL